MTLRKIFVAFMVLLSLALSACGGDNKNPIAPTPAPAPTPTTAPDLVVDAPTVNDNSPATGAPFTLSATVRNAGDGESAATTLRFYQSTDETITTADAEVGTAAVGELAASATSSESISLTAPSTAGTYYYGACVDAVTDESDTANNCAAAVQVTVPEPGATTAPDLVVDAPTVNDNGPATGAPFTLSATVRNAGDGESAATTLRFYQSTDETITTADTEAGTAAVWGLAASATSSESISLTAPSTAGTYYYGACVDAVTDESDTANNCAAAVQVTVPEPGATTAPDLVVDAPTVDVSPKNDDRLELQYGGALGVPRTERMGPMKRSKFSEEQVAYALRQAEAGTAVGDVCRQVGISEATFYAWKKKYAHLGVSELRRLRQIEEENTRLKRLVADLSLDKHMLSEALRKKV